MKTFLNANMFVSFVLWLTTMTNWAFAIEGGSPLPAYMRTVYLADAVEIAFWLMAGIIYLVWLWCKRKDNRRLGILRYDGQRGEWYYQK